MEEKKRNAKGEGSFTVNANKTVTHRKVVGYKSNGKRKVITVTADTKTACLKEMRKKEAAWKKENERGRLDATATVEYLCELHLLSQVEGGELKGKSVDRRECTIKNHISGGYSLEHKQIQSIISKDIENHINDLISEKRLSVSSIEKVVDVLNAAWSWAVRCQMLEENPVFRIKPALDRKIQKLKTKGANEADVIVLSESEQICLRNVALSKKRNGEYLYAGGRYILLLLYTGMRGGEMTALRWRDVDMEKGLLTIDKNRTVIKNRAGNVDKKYIIHEDSTKNEKARIISLTGEAKEILYLIREESQYVERDDFITPTRTGACNTVTNLEHRAEAIYRAADLEVLGGSLHVLRRTLATRMYDNGAPIKQIASYIGDSEATTEKYYIAVRKKIVSEGKVTQIVPVPGQRQIQKIS